MCVLFQKPSQAFIKYNGWQKNKKKKKQIYLPTFIF